MSDAEDEIVVGSKVWVAVLEGTTTRQRRGVVQDVAEVRDHPASPPRRVCKVRVVGRAGEQGLVTRDAKELVPQVDSGETGRELVKETRVRLNSASRHLAAARHVFEVDKEEKK